MRFGVKHAPIFVNICQFVESSASLVRFAYSMLIGGV
jgi:hypothetical protein